MHPRPDDAFALVRRGRGDDTASLHIIRGPGSGTRVALEKEHAVIGRSPDCDVLVPFLSLSRRHAEITRRGGRFVLRDLDSRGGTWLNMRQIRGLSPLRDGDRIRVCDFEASFEFPATPLTEGEWLGSSDSQAMLGWLRTCGGAGGQRLRLFAAACCRRFGLLGQGADAAAAVALAERFAEGEAPPDAVPHGDARRHAVWAADAREAAADSARQAAEAASSPLAWPEQTGTWTAPRRRTDDETWAAYDAAEGVLCGLLRDVFGPPAFRPVPAIDASLLAWNAAAVKKIAEAVRGDQAFDRLPLLADPLEEAGCTDASLLSHCRGSGRHVRGCWAVDLVLEKY